MEPPATTYAMRVATEIRGELARQRVGIGDLAGHLSLSRQSLRRRLDGTTPFTITELDAVAGRLGLSTAELLLRVEEVA